MKTIILFGLIILMVGCETIDQAKNDFNKFKSTIEYNSKQPVVYKNAQF